ncbi:AP-5 complex subunit beta-1 isoform X2 [Protopterus annectens]|nr:AP-5 complex subunit beta-1 isoform X2 [Protopterus annectens]XP_043917825.1 AP-5 complex subunit beta-1 isoform X2 [Protopterus annectens]
MAANSGDILSQHVAEFHFSPSLFLSRTSADTFLSEILLNLRDYRISESIKVQALSLFAEFPTFLCQTSESSETTALALLEIFSQLSASTKSWNLQVHLLLAITTILISTDCFKEDIKPATDLLELLFQIVSEQNDGKQGLSSRHLKTMACDCLWELECCYPELLSTKLELLHTLQQLATSTLYQKYTLLFSTVLKNAIQGLAHRQETSNSVIKDILSHNEGFSWKSSEESEISPSVFTKGYHLLPSTVESKELKSILSLLLEESFLLTPVSQSILFHNLIQIVTMVYSLSPVIFKSQLLRLFGTMDVCLFITVLKLKGAFTESLFTTEDENFLVKRLSGMSQHPMLSNPLKLLYLDFLLHFPENRPISSSAEESPPILLTPSIATLLFPTVFHDSSTVLSRLTVLCLVYLENEDEDQKGINLISDFMRSLQKIVENNGGREVTVTFFRSIFLFVKYLSFCSKQMDSLVTSLAELYQKHYALAPYIIDLINNIQLLLQDSVWPISLLQTLQHLIVGLPVNRMDQQALKQHLKVLARVAKEDIIQQKCTVDFLLRLIGNIDFCQLSSWRMGSTVLSVCRNLLLHRDLKAIFLPLGDLLQLISVQFEDLDIRDHARFYYMLLTSLSSEKLARILSPGSTGNNTKVHTLSTIMAESEIFSSLTVQFLEQPLLQLVECQEVEVASIPSSSSSSAADMKLDTSYRQEYEKQFADPEFASTVVLKYYLTFTEAADHQYDKLFSILLRFEQTDSTFEPINDISVHCLFQGQKPCIVSLLLHPRQVSPSFLNVSAIFTTKEGFTCHNQLKPLQIRFPDLFLPLPVPSHWSTVAKQKLFDQLWESFSPSLSNDYGESLCCLQVGKDFFHSLVYSKLCRFLIDVQHGLDFYKVLFFLAPHCHILLKLSWSEETLSVKIVTDNWKLLPYLNVFLKDISVND